MCPLRNGCVLSGIVAAFLVASTLPCRAQGTGDYNADGYVDAEDFWYWAACMTGPAGGELPSGCEAFDFDLGAGPDGKVDLADLAAFGAAFTGSPCTPAVKYAYAQKSASATGCAARIRTRPTKLCGEPDSNKGAQSQAWAAVTKVSGQTPVKWAQMGYVTWRNAGETTVQRRVYAETLAGPNFLRAPNRTLAS